MIIVVPVTEEQYQLFFSYSADNNQRAFSDLFESISLQYIGGGDPFSLDTVLGNLDYYFPKLNALDPIANPVAGKEFIDDLFQLVVTARDE